MTQRWCKYCDLLKIVAHKGVKVCDDCYELKVLRIKVTRLKNQIYNGRVELKDKFKKFQEELKIKQQKIIDKG